MEDLTYVICTTPRTGSTSLLDYLRRSKVAGNPKEYPDSVFYNGIYGTSVHRTQVDSTFYLPESRVYKYIHLYRKDKIAQAVSWVIASQTGKWQLGQECVGIPSYDYYQIEKAVQQIKLDNDDWEGWLEDKDEVLKISYEELSKDYSQGTRKILKFLNVREVTVPPKPGKVGTKLNQDWIKQWKEENERIRNFHGEK